MTDFAVVQLLPRRVCRGNSIAARPDLEAEAHIPPPENDGDEEPTVHNLQRATTIRFEYEPAKPTTDETLYVPPPHLRDRGHPLVKINGELTWTKKETRTRLATSTQPAPVRKRGRSLERAASAAFSIGPMTRERSRRSTSRERTMPKGMPKLSTQVTIGRNSHFHNLSAGDRDILGGVEYVALKLLLKLIIGQGNLVAALAIC